MWYSTPRKRWSSWEAWKICVLVTVGNEILTDSGVSNSEKANLDVDVSKAKVALDTRASVKNTLLTLRASRWRSWVLIILKLSWVKEMSPASDKFLT